MSEGMCAMSVCDGYHVCDKCLGDETHHKRVCDKLDVCVMSKTYGS